MLERQVADPRRSPLCGMVKLPRQERTGIGRVALLTGGGDKPYALGIAEALTSRGVLLDFIGSDDLAVSPLLDNPRITFLNLRRDQNPEASFVAKFLRVSAYYLRLIRYAAMARTEIFHILWHNKFVLFDRTILLGYYRLLGKSVVITAHNVNAGKRDRNDSWLNRFSLKAEYLLSDHIFVHTQRMKEELVAEFDISAEKITVIPFGINNTVPDTSLSQSEARQRLRLRQEHKVLLFFGNIAPYKGVEHLVTAFEILSRKNDAYRLILVGKPKGEKDYWERIRDSIERSDFRDRVIQRIEYVPDEETELYFKAADVSVLPYKHIFQSGVLFLGYSFGLPAIAADVGSLREEIIEGETGLIFKPEDPVDLARAIEQYFGSPLFQNLSDRRLDIKKHANERYSWAKVGTITCGIYSDLLRK